MGRSGTPAPRGPGWSSASSAGWERDRRDRQALRSPALSVDPDGDRSLGCAPGGDTTRLGERDQSSVTGLDEHASGGRPPRIRQVHDGHVLPRGEAGQTPHRCRRLRVEASATCACRRTVRADVDALVPALGPVTESDPRGARRCASRKDRSHRPCGSGAVRFLWRTSSPAGPSGGERFRGCEREDDGCEREGDDARVGPRLQSATRPVPTHARQRHHPILHPPRVKRQEVVRRHRRPGGAGGHGGERTG
jgi:hypothetical protein